MVVLPAKRVKAGEFYSESTLPRTQCVSQDSLSPSFRFDVVTFLIGRPIERLQPKRLSTHGDFETREAVLGHASGR